MMSAREGHSAVANAFFEGRANFDVSKCKSTLSSSIMFAFGVLFVNRYSFFASIKCQYLLGFFNCYYRKLSLQSFTLLIEGI